MVPDISQELELVQQVGPENGVLEVYIEEDPPKDAPEPRLRV